MNPWLIVQEEFSLPTAQAYEGLFTLGSGYLHTLPQPRSNRC